MVKALVAIFSLVGSSAFAAGNFTCTVEETLNYSYDCMVCKQLNGDNECVSEAPGLCHTYKYVKTGVTATASSVKNEIFLSASDETVFFFLSAGNTGYSARLTAKDGAQAAIGNSSPLNLKSGNFTLGLKLNQPIKKTDGEVVAVNLVCKAH